MLMWELALLREAERALTEIDLALYEWQTAADMMSFIGQEIPMRVFETEPAQMDRVTVKRMPLIRKEDGKRIVIGAVDLDEASSVIKAELHPEHAHLLAIGHQAYSIADEDPPKLNHEAIKAQLKTLIDPELYRNPYSLDTMSIADFRSPKMDSLKNIKMMVEGEWTDIDGVHPFFNEYSKLRATDGTELDNHPFFKET